MDHPEQVKRFLAFGALFDIWNSFGSMEHLLAVGALFGTWNTFACLSL
jgi:hypothetical protein